MEEIQIPWSRLAGFIRKHTHDVRNDLNSLDLESAFLEEIVPAGEMQTGVARIRKQLPGGSQALHTWQRLANAGWCRLCRSRTTAVAWSASSAPQQ